MLWLTVASFILYELAFVTNVAFYDVIGLNHSETRLAIGLWRADQVLVALFQFVSSVSHLIFGVKYWVLGRRVQGLLHEK
jgi:hypothetical protein